MIPRAILLDLDDTILDDSGSVNESWRATCEVYAARLAPLDAAVVLDAIRKTSKWYWSDPDRHREGRLQLEAARREVVRLALKDLDVDDPELAACIGDEYSRLRDVGMSPLPEAIDTVRWLRDSGRRLALLTNGAALAQRRKIVRFAIADLFDAIFVEGELGFGKPDERVYRKALSVLGIQPFEAWMVGDNLEFDVAAPQKLGMTGIWIDARGRGVPADSSIVPDYTVRRLADLRSLITNASQSR